MEVKEGMPADKQQLEQIANALDTFNDKLAKVAKFSQERIEKTAEDYTKKPAQTLSGILGGTTGTGLGIALGTYILATTHLLAVAAICPPLLGVAGVVGAIYYWRSRRSFVTLEATIGKIERATEFNQRLLNALPKSIDHEQRQMLFRQHAEMVAQYQRVIFESLTGYSFRPIDSQHSVQYPPDALHSSKAAEVKAPVKPLDEKETPDVSDAERDTLLKALGLSPKSPARPLASYLKTDDSSSDNPQEVQRVFTRPDVDD